MMSDSPLSLVRAYESPSLSATNIDISDSSQHFKRKRPRVAMEVDVPYGLIQEFTFPLINTSTSFGTHLNFPACPNTKYQIKYNQSWDPTRAFTPTARPSFLMLNSSATPRMPYVSMPKAGSSSKSIHLTPPFATTAGLSFCPSMPYNVLTNAANEYLVSEPSFSSQDTAYIEVEDMNQPSRKEDRVILEMESDSSTGEEDKAKEYEKEARADAMNQALEENIQEVSSKTETTIKKKPVIGISAPRLGTKSSEQEDIDQHFESKEDEDFDRPSGKGDLMMVENMDCYSLQEEDDKRYEAATSMAEMMHILAVKAKDVQ